MTDQPFHPSWHGRATAPACFATATQWSTWKQHARLSNLRGTYCTDCTPEHKAAMLAQGKCERPGVTFSRDEDGFIQGTDTSTPTEGAQP